MYQLEDAILTVAKEVRLIGDEKTNKQTDEVLALFRSRGPQGAYARRRAMRRVNRYLRIKGIDWPIIDWAALLDWIKENWMSILKVILTLLPLILI